MDPQLAETLHLDEVPKALLLTPVRRGQANVGLAVVSSDAPLTRQTVHAVDGLMAQASLALERAQLAEDVHRQRVEARFRSLVQNATDLITVIDTDDTIRYQSPSVRRMLGYEPCDLEGTNFFDLIHDDDVPRARTFVASSSAGQNVVDARLHHQNGTGCPSR